MYTYKQIYFQYKKLYNIYIKKLILILNTVHKKKYDQIYWEPIIGIYLRRYLINYLFLYNLRKNKNLFKDVDIKKVIFFKNYREFSENKSFSPLDKFYLFHFKVKKYSKFEKINNLNFFSKLINSIKITFPNILIKLGVIKILYFESYFKKNLKRIMSLKSLFYFYPIPNLNVENFEFKKNIIFKNRLSLLYKYEHQIKGDKLLQNIIFSMPINYIENFKVISNEVKKIKLSPAIYTDGNEVNFDFLKFYIARLKINKKKTLVGQHSLRSGIDDYDVFFDYSKSFFNYFLTWGWKTKDIRIKKFSSLRLFSSLKKYKKIKSLNNKFLNICYIFCSYSVMGESLYDNYIENIYAENSRIKLLKFIKRNKKIKISLKPRTGSFILNNKSGFYQQFETLKYKTRMYDVLGKFDLIIFERMSLGIVECICLNQPTIFYYSKNLYEIKNKEYVDLFQMMKKAKILIDNQDDLQKIIDGKNLSDWWYDKTNIIMRKKIIQKYANSFNFRDLKKLKKYIN